MSRIQTTFVQLAKQQRKALIPYVMAGFPRADASVPVLHVLAAAGADIIELGIPFSDPMADGPVIQKAAETVLRAGMNLSRVLELVSVFRSSNQETPIVLMGYANPIECYDLQHGRHAFVRAAAQAGVDGVLVVDYPPQECTEFKAELQRHGLDLIFLLAPTSSEERMAQVGALASGYVYYVSLKGVTGSSALDTADVACAVPRIRAHIPIPIGVGFGIRDTESAKAVAAVCDGVVVGSKIIQLLEQPGGVEQAEHFVQDLRQALDSIEYSQE